MDVQVLLLLIMVLVESGFGWKHHIAGETKGWDCATSTSLQIVLGVDRTVGEVDGGVRR